MEAIAESGVVYGLMGSLAGALGDMSPNLSYSFRALPRLVELRAGRA
jgi:hypothetical protein